MFLRLFNIALICAYFFSVYAQIGWYGYVNSLKGIVFTESKNLSPSRTKYVSANLPKHIHAFYQIKLGDHPKSIKGHSTFDRLLITYLFISSENTPFKISLDSPLNKAPPAYT
ncbi:MAG: hypothetical protein ACM339_06285 [Ignavibacteria bacterium]